MDDQTTVVRKQRRATATLGDCFEDFKQTETLDEDNKWYCSKCKDHVQANKTMELHQVPRVLIITLKRFKQTKSRYGGMGFGMDMGMFSGGEKLDTLVDFPLNGFDMSPYVRSEA